MTKAANQSWPADYRWWLVIGALLAGVVWRISHRQAAQPVASSEALSTFALDQEQLPENWSINYNSPTMIGLSQTTADSCYVDVNHHQRSTELNATEFEAKIIRDNRESIEDDKYTFHDLGRAKMSIQTTDGSVTLPSYEYATSWLEGEVQSHQSLAIVVDDDGYTSISLSCPTDDLSPANTALQAVEFGV